MPTQRSLYDLMCTDVIIAVVDGKVILEFTGDTWDCRAVFDAEKARTLADHLRSAAEEITDGQAE